MFKHKIALIIPYFGTFKNYFPLFLLSCKNNPSIDWFIFTDTEVKYSWPANVKQIFITFTEFKEIVQENFEFSISLDTPYKLCDYKPAYGEILHKYIQEYDFWGHCDCDLIFGDIRAFVTDEVLDQNSKIFSRGHLTIYRNNKETNSFYRIQKYMDYKKVYTSSKSYSFDEWPGVSSFWEQSGKSFYDELPYDDIIMNLSVLWPTKRISTKENGSPYHLYNNDISDIYKKMKHIIYKYANGKLFRIWTLGNRIYDEEVMYVHLQKRAMDVVDVALLLEEEAFILCPNKFIRMDEKSIMSVVGLRRLAPRCKPSDMKTIIRRKLRGYINKFHS